MKKELLIVLLFALLLAGNVFAAPKSASAYFSDASFQYIENRLPTAEITCNEGLQYYPNDQKLQMLLDRIKEAKDEQKNENKKNDPKNDQNNDQNQDQNKDQQNQDQNQNQNSGESSSSQSDDQQNQDQNGGQSSSSSAGESSSSQGGEGEQPQQPENQQGNSSDSQGEQPEQPQELPAGAMSPEEAAQLLKDFDEQNGERKPWKPIRGQARPARDW